MASRPNDAFSPSALASSKAPHRDVRLPFEQPCTRRVLSPTGVRSWPGSPVASQRVHLPARYQGHQQAAAPSEAPLSPSASSCPSTGTARFSTGRSNSIIPRRHRRPAALQTEANESSKCPHMKRLLVKKETFHMAAPEPGSRRISNWRYQAHCLLMSQHFDATIGVVILLNSLAIGWESEVDLQAGDITLFLALEQVFLVVYIMELTLRVFAHGRACLSNGWVRFDISLLALGLVSSWIIEPIATASLEGGEMQDTAELLLFLRMLRLARLARAVRLIVQFRSLWKMIRGLLSSAGTMLYTFLIVTVMLYIFSCAAMELITKNRRSDPQDEMYDQVWADLVAEFYPDILNTMLTLVQFVVLDSIRDQYVPLVKRDPILLFFFVTVILVVSISMMNLVTAVIVEVSLEQAKQDQANQCLEQVTLILPKLQDIFHRMDRNGTGTISMRNITNADPDTLKDLMKLMHVDKLEDLFDMVDVDCVGEVPIDEFLNVVARAVTTAAPVEFIQLTKQLSSSREDIKDIQKQLRTLTLMLNSRLERSCTKSLKCELTDMISELWEDVRDIKYSRVVDDCAESSWTSKRLEASCGKPPPVSERCSPDDLPMTRSSKGMARSCDGHSKSPTSGGGSTVMASGSAVMASEELMEPDEWTGMSSTALPKALRNDLNGCAFGISSTDWPENCDELPSLLPRPRHRMESEGTIISKMARSAEGLCKQSFVDADVLRARSPPIHEEQEPTVNAHCEAGGSPLHIHFN